MGYFKPWRRKIGVCTLAMACLLAAGWVRSRRLVDTFGLPIGKVISQYDGISLHRIVKDTPYSEPFPPPLIETEEYNAVWDSYNHPDDRDHWSLRCCGFGYNERYWGVIGSIGDKTFSGTDTHKYWRVPYWSIVIPLILLSAWVLLSKPHQSKSKMHVDYFPETVSETCENSSVLLTTLLACQIDLKYRDSHGVDFPGG